MSGSGLWLRSLAEGHAWPAPTPRLQEDKSASQALVALSPELAEGRSGDQMMWEREMTCRQLQEASDPQMPRTPRLPSLALTPCQPAPVAQHLPS